MKSSEQMRKRLLGQENMKRVKAIGIIMVIQSLRHVIRVEEDLGHMDGRWFEFIIHHTWVRPEIVLSLLDRIKELEKGSVLIDSKEIWALKDKVNEIQELSNRANKALWGIFGLAHEDPERARLINRAVNLVEQMKELLNESAT